MSLLSHGFVPYLSILALALVAGCGGGTAASNPIGTPSGSNNLGGVAATGAPLSRATVVLKSLGGEIIVSTTTNDAAFFQVALDPARAPYIAEVTDSSVSPSMKYEALILKDDISASGANVNITPISTIVTRVAINEGLAGKTDSVIKAIRANAVTQVKKAIQPLLDAMNVTDTAEQLLTRQFVPTQDPLDKVLDTFTVSCTSASCTISPVSDTANKALAGSTLAFDVSSASAASTSATKVASKLDTVKGAMAASAPVVVVFSPAGKWGSPADNWAGYNGKFAIYNFSDSAIDGGSKLYLGSSKLNATGFWNVSAAVDGKGSFLFELPSWANLAPLSAQGKPSPFVFGFTGKGAPESVTDLRDCNINGQKCLVLIDDGKQASLDSADASVKVRSWAQFLVTLPQQVQEKKPEAEVPPPATDPTPKDSPISTEMPTSAKAAVVASVTSSWVGGFNGSFQLKNTSSDSWTNWSLKLTMPAGVTRVTSWGNYKLTTESSVVTFGNESWNGKLSAGAPITLGFGGEGALSTVPSACEISYNGGAYSSCTIALGGSTVPPTPVVPPTPAVPSTGAEEPQSIATSKSAITNKRVYVGYYPSWSDNWFSSANWDGSALTNDAILKASKLARVPATYTHVVASFAQPNFSYTTAGNYTANKWDGTGLNFNAGPKDIKRAVDVLHARGIKVLLAVGGATYNDWAGLAAEGGNVGPITTALKQIMIDVGFDGLDVDYEVEGANPARVAEYTGAVNAVRKAVDLAGGGRILALAGWSTGADCTIATGTTATACGGKASYWSGSAGRERLVFSQDGMAAKIDMINIMSYDARYENYDGVKAWELYRDLFPSTTIVSIGLETAPEGWAGGMLVTRNTDTLCAGSTILKDQFSNVVNLPYSVERYAKAVMTTRTNSNPRDGAMLWQILKTATATCGTSTVASPGSIANMIGDVYGLQKDDRAAWE